MDTAPPMWIAHEVPAEKPKKKSVRDDTGAIPLNVTTMIQATMIMMSTLILIFSYRACVQGIFECDLAHWPDISHTMGIQPNNKLYAMMFTIYSFSKQAETRAWYQRLQGVAIPFVNNLMFIPAIMSFIFGPCIGFWDCYYDMDIHQQVT
jgi:hypothetical protein